LAVQGFSTSHALVPQQWSEGLEAEVLKKVSYTGLIGKRSDALLQWKDTLSTKPGDTETIGLRMQLNSAPKSSNQALEGNEQTLTLYDMSFTMDEVADAVRFKNIIDRQRVTFDMRDEAKAALADQLSAAWDTSLFTQLGGARHVSDATFYGHNSILDPQQVSGQAHYITGDSAGAATTDEALSGDADTFRLELLDIAVERAKTLSPAIRPARIPGFDRPLYVCFIHPYQLTSLRRDEASTGASWLTLMRDAMQGGKVDDNPLVTGAMGVYNDVLLIESTRVPLGVNSSTGASVAGVRRAIFCGAQSAVIAWGRLGGTPRRFRWVEKQFEYDREYGISAGFLGGIKLTQFNGKPFGSIVIPTVAVAAS
jgi:N4-gp56 family major capsid protein